MAVKTITIWHNPRCSKSRQTLALLNERGIEPEIRLYLKNPPSRAELAEAIAALGGDPRALLRNGETRAKELGLAKETNDDVIIEAMLAEPILIERPLVLMPDGRAALGRPPEAVLALL